MSTQIVAKCRHCGIDIAQGPSGAWAPTDRDNILGVCQKGRIGEPLMLHEPMPAGLDGAAAVVDRDERGPTIHCPRCDGLHPSNYPCI
ncbi:Uncharacterised protein [Mycobacteroides abscessus subsp. massiliense]|nr:Uncharacterised protein [Mycobacteroides abscessus subsp. massiliense]